MKLSKILQTFERKQLADIPAAVHTAMKGTGLALPKGARVAVTAGSRGIANIAVILKSVCGVVREMGGEPFIVPAMGSHGGATAEGQQAIIEDYGVTEAFVGAPILSSMKVAELDSEGLGHRMFMDRHAYESHGVIIVNRVKIHTDFHGPFESGMMKMCVIGLGKHAQALEMHSFGSNGLRDKMPPAARRIIESGKILMGVGILENAYDETADIRAALPQDIEKTELEMLDWNRAHMPSLPVDDVDVLIVDRIGKDISGVCMDSNIIGRLRVLGVPEPVRPRIKMIIADDLTEETHGNASGMGLADLITEKLRSKIDFAATYENVLTSSFTARGSMPVVVKNALEGLRQSARSCGYGVSGMDELRVMRIRDTLHLSEVYVSDSLLADVSLCKNAEITGLSMEAFDGQGELVAWA